MLWRSLPGVSVAALCASSSSMGGGGFGATGGPFAVCFVLTASGLAASRGLYGGGGVKGFGGQEVGPPRSFFKNGFNLALCVRLKNSWTRGCARPVCCCFLGGRGVICGWGFSVAAVGGAVDRVVAWSRAPSVCCNPRRDHRRAVSAAGGPPSPVLLARVSRGVRSGVVACRHPHAGALQDGATVRDVRWGD